MARDESISRLGGWEGYEVRQVRERWDQRQRWVQIELEPIAGRERICEGCGQATRAIHDCCERRIRDLPVFDACTELIVPRLRVACARCGPKLERLTGLSPMPV